MASIHSTVTSPSSMGNQPQLRQSTLDQGADLSSAITLVNLPCIYTPGALSSPQSFGSQSKLSGGFLPAHRQTTWDTSGLPPQIFRNTAENSDTVLQQRAPWRGFFHNGCLSYKCSHVCADLLVSCAPWTDKSTVGLLAKMFKAEYFRVFNNPFVTNPAAARIIVFVEAVVEWVDKRKGLLVLLDLQRSIQQVALDGFYLSIVLVNISPCYMATGG